jgi:hypothetical protein
MQLRLCRLSLFLLLSPCLSAVIIKTPPAPSLPTLQQLTQRAGYIFAGTVLSVERVQPKSQNEVATVQITFRVDQAVRGVSSRQNLVIREWAGLWDSGDRYHRGEQVLLFLYQPSKLGLTSPVNGSLGRFKLDSSGRILLNAARLAALQIDAPTLSARPILSGTTSINSRDLVRLIRRAGD